MENVFNACADTYRHSLRVQALVQEFAMYLASLPECPPSVTMRRLTLAAAYSPLHDIGKRKIPLEILYKKGPLTEKERDIMQTHPAQGLDVLAIYYPHLSTGGGEEGAAARNIILHHHEHWDGSGYPMGLRGHQIPLEARVVALADVYDALTQERSYKRPWGKKEALAFIKKQKGVVFDPYLTDAFCEMKERETLMAAST